MAEMPTASFLELPAAPRDGAPRAGEVPARRRRIREMDVVVADVVRETHDTVTLYFDACSQRLDYRAGQFLTIDPHQFDVIRSQIAFLEDLKGKREPPRAYSMSSAPHERYLAVTVKEEPYVSGQTKYPPLLSPVLVRAVTPGMRMAVVGFTGPYVLPEDVEARTEHVVHVCAGSGSVPNFAILKDALAHHRTVRHTFVYSNKTWDDVIFRDQLAAIEARFPDRLRVLHTLTREATPESRGQGVRKGRVSRDLLAEAISDPKACLVYACGPAVGPHERAAARARCEPPAPRFLETVLVALRELGVPDSSVKRESW